ncbi:hypothetical protein FBY35_3845 [Streptomyces sp. SLBN-118]|nr:hypothetical protein FBY35_3845 [Streptomyces sp. SLBN-118]
MSAGNRRRSPSLGADARPAWSAAAAVYPGVRRYPGWRSRAPGQQPGTSLRCRIARIRLYEDDSPPCDAPHLTPRAHPPGIAGQPLGNAERAAGISSLFRGFEFREGERWLSAGVIEGHGNFLPPEAGWQVFRGTEQSPPIVSEGRALNDNSGRHIDPTLLEFLGIKKDIENVLCSMFLRKAGEFLHDAFHCRRADKGRQFGQRSFDLRCESFVGRHCRTSPPTDAHTMYPTEAHTVILSSSSPPAGNCGSVTATSPRVTDEGFSKYRVVRRNPSGTGIPLLVSSSTLAKRVAFARRSDSGVCSISLSIFVNSGCDATSASTLLSSLSCSGVGCVVWAVTF